MFNFFHRTPEINLDCFTCDPNVHKYTPIVSASKTIPEWFLNVPVPENPVELDFINEEVKHRNIRSCYGFLEFYKKGVVMESWCDMGIKTETDSFQCFFSGPPDPISHKSEQYGNAFSKYFNLKMRSPWLFNCSQNINFMFVGAEWSLGDYDIKVLPGIVNFELASSGNFFIMIPRKQDQFIINMGTPMIHIVPLTEKKIKHKVHLLTKGEYAKKINVPSYSFFGWRKVKGIIKRNEKRGCPFSDV